MLTRTVAICALIISVLGFYFAARLAVADWYAHRPTAEAASKSIALAPGNSAYILHAAELAESNGTDAGSLRLQAAELNPLDSSNWIHLATGEETQNHLNAAEQDLKRAYAADRQFEPRWALANFYYRRGDTAQALEWAHKSLEFGRGDLNAVFELCWSVTDDATRILEAVPPSAATLAKYVSYLDTSGRIEEATQAVVRLVPIAGPDEEQPIMDHCSRSLKTGDVQGAVTAWNGLVARHLIAFDLASRPLVNGAFEHPFSGQGFDWEPRKVDGVSLERQPQKAALRIDFSGAEPESCIMMGAYMRVDPGSVYRFHTSYETSGMGGAGVSWFVYDPATNAPLMSAGPSNFNAANHVIEAGFETPPQCRLARIELRYARAVGTVKPDGSITFSKLSVEPSKAVEPSK